MGKYELVIVWDSGEKEVHEYKTKEEAEKAMAGMYMAFGHHQLWCCVREKRE